MTGKRISEEEFERNYRQAAKSGAEFRSRKGLAIRARLAKSAKIPKKEIHRETKELYNPVYLHFAHLMRMSEEAYLFRFDDGTEHWFPKAYCRLYNRIKVIAIPKTFAKERGLMEFAL